MQRRNSLQRRKIEITKALEEVDKKNKDGSQYNSQKKNQISILFFINTINCINFNIYLTNKLDDPSIKPRKV